MCLSSGLAAAVALGSLLAAQTSIKVPTGGIDLPMGDIGGRPAVDVTVNGKGPFPFILDTGADVIVVDEELVGLHTPEDAPPKPPMKEDPATRIKSLGIGDALLLDVDVHPSPLARLFGGSFPARGVLSAASFPGYLLVLDYPGKRIRIRKGELPPADLRTRFEYTSEQILPNVPLQVAGTEVRVHVDTGSPGSVTLPTKYMKELPLAAEPTRVGLARTAAGEFPIWAADVKGEVALGSYKFDNSRVLFSDVNPIPGPPTGNLGYQTLRQFIITLDAKNRRIQFEK